MKTDDLIRAIVSDNASRKPPLSRTLMLALVGGIILAALHFWTLLAVRSDFLRAIAGDPRFMLKFLFTLGLAIPAAFLVLRLARPDGQTGNLKWLLMLPLAMLAAGVAFEMQAYPADQWVHIAQGSMPFACAKYIPLLSAAPFLALMFALRNGAPARPALAGAAAGLFSASIAAALYASFCTDDSPMFLAVWYVLGIALVTALGALIGARLLKW